MNVIFLPQAGFNKPVAVYGIINIRVLPQVGKMVYALDIGHI